MNGYHRASLAPIATAVCWMWLLLLGLTYLVTYDINHSVSSFADTAGLPVITRLFLNGHLLIWGILIAEVSYIFWLAKRRSLPRAAISWMLCAVIIMNVSWAVFAMVALYYRHARHWISGSY